MSVALLNAASVLPSLPASASALASPPPVAAARPKRRAPLWMLVVAQLDVLALEYSTAELAPLLKMQQRQVRNYCKKLFPDAETRGALRQYRLDFAQACVLIYSVSRDCRTLKQDELWEELLQEGIITPSFPGIVDEPGQVDAKIAEAFKAILADRDARTNAPANRGAVASAVLAAV